MMDQAKIHEQLHRPPQREPGCPCCDNFGSLPFVASSMTMNGEPGILIDGEVVRTMCAPCILGTFIAPTTHAHPHPIGRPI